eukprot:CAMPEP_0173449030 /NCGR_PEP_ID=MMETSP1357-20121228/41972_1 /TAXON_ID=77926 /ORGANISM="Hemiselmis rufescens, Strain PCC563" /LENGTH=84 /DNA_ID=CAMNT_0014415585 /DNA_START=41 /DNA_END=291 /DNA_ORIENTATION=-
MATKYAASLLTAEVQAAQVKKGLGSPGAARRRPEGSLSVIEERDELWDDDEGSVTSAESDGSSVGSPPAVAGFMGWVLSARLSR